MYIWDSLPSFIYIVFLSPPLETIRGERTLTSQPFFSRKDNFPISIVMGPHCARGRSVTGMVYYSSPIAGLSPAVSRRHPFIDLGVERQSREKSLVQCNKATAMLEPRTPDEARGINP